MSAREVSRSDLPLVQGVSSLPHHSEKPHLPEPQSLQEQKTDLFKAEEIPCGIFQFFDDPQWMMFVTDLFASASLICSLMNETKANEFVPYLSILSSPFYLRQAIKDSIQRFKLMASACRTARVADAFFWLTGAVGSVGIAVGDIVKPLAGGATLFGLASIPILNTTFSFIIPIVLIVFSTIGGVNQGWGLGRTEMALHVLKQRRRGIVSLREAEALIRNLKEAQTPSTEDSLAKHHYDLDTQYFQDTHSTTDDRREEVQKRIELFLKKNESTQVQMARAALSRVLPLIQKTQDSIISPEGTLSQQIESTLSNCDQAISIAQSMHVDVSELMSARDALIQLRDELAQEGTEIIETVHSEMHRKIMQQKVSILTSLINLGAGILFLVAPSHYHYIGYILSLSACALGGVKVIFDKAISQKRFLQIEQGLNLLEIKPE